MPRELFDYLVDPTEVFELHGAVDEQTADLLYEIVVELQAQMEMPDGTLEALGRLLGALDNRNSWDEGLLRNNIFKVANSLGMELPGYSF